MSGEDRPRFIVDINVGRLAKWLRVMGYDALLIPQADDDEIIRIALREGRVVVTKDARMAERRVVTTGMVRMVVVRSDHLKEQLRQVISELGLRGGAEFSRCIRCNLPLAPVPRERVRERVPPYVFRTQRSFMECPGCRRVYWRGTHWANMLSDLAEVKGEA